MLVLSPLLAVIKCQTYETWYFVVHEETTGFHNVNIHMSLGLFLIDFETSLTPNELSKKTKQSCDICEWGYSIIQNDRNK